MWQIVETFEQEPDDDVASSGKIVSVRWRDKAHSEGVIEDEDISCLECPNVVSYGRLLSDGEDSLVLAGSVFPHGNKATYRCCTALPRANVMEVTELRVEDRTVSIASQRLEPIWESKVAFEAGRWDGTTALEQVVAARWRDTAHFDGGVEHGDVPKLDFATVTSYGRLIYLDDDKVILAGAVIAARGRLSYGCCTVLPRANLLAVGELRKD